MARRQGCERWGFREKRWREAPMRKWKGYEVARRKEEREEKVVVKRDRLAIIKRRIAMNEEKIRARRRMEQEHQEFINKYKGIII